MIRIIFSACCFFAVSFLGVYWTNLHQAALQNEQRLLMSEIVRAQAAAIERRLSRSLSATYILAQEIRRNGGEIEDFESFATDVIETLGGIANLQLAPAGIVGRIFPLQGNEAAIGYDILNDANQRTDALRAIENRMLTLAGPFKLIRGGVAVIGRNPVFINVAGTEKFWGFTQALILMDTLLAETGFGELESKGYGYQLFRINAQTNEKELIASSSRALGQNSYQLDLIVPNNRWTLMLSKLGGSAIIGVIPWYLLSVFLGLLLGLALFANLRQTERLVHSKNIALKANHAKDEFLASISHEIRTPLSGLIEVMQLLKRTRLDPNQSRFVDTASSSAKMLLTIIDDILVFARTESAKFSIDSSSFDLTELIEDVAYILALEANRNGLELVTDVDSDVPQMIKTDPIRLRQVLNNLLNNSIRFTRQGVVLIYARRVGETVQVGVTDTGTGLSEQQRQEILKIFPQPGEHYKRRSDSAGIGLTISRRLIEAMGSKLQFDTSVAEGNHLYFQIPVDPEQPQPYDWNPPQSLQNLSIAILSPFPQRRFAFRKMLLCWHISQIEELDYNCDEAQALPQIRPCDLVIVDQQRSEQAVNEMIENMRNNSEWREARFIRLVPQEAISESGGIDLRISKPLSQSHFFAGLMDMIYRRAFGSEYPSLAEPGPDQPPGPLQGRRILLVEDDQINKMIALEILEQTGAVVDAVEDGVQAVKQVKQRTYDLILMDIQLPLMDGYQATREIRKLGGVFEIIPIIAMTAFAQHGDSSKSSAAGMNDHITKPFEPDYFIAIIVRNLRQRNQ